MAEHFNDYGIPHHPERFQDVLNQSWPPPKVAEKLSDDASIPVTVRIVWARDGETWLDGTASKSASPADSSFHFDCCVLLTEDPPRWSRRPRGGLAISSTCRCDSGQTASN